MVKRLNEMNTDEIFEMMMRQSNKDTIIVSRRQYKKIKNLVSIGYIKVTNMPQLKIED